ncbi:ATP-binding protein [Thermoactinospora rubra]|uniref:ATP-binding protein n=1 Tax=Thermoactinospora rubra TaxID=1088767 RepID=UPI000A12100B|nr:ATP-binding protein [Thermoactinospora rubra]
MTFRLADLPKVRHVTEDAARGLGLGEDAVGDVVVAVNEVATNAVTHGDPDGAQLVVWCADDSMVVEIHDRGTWTPEGTPGEAAPAPHATRGMGLWLARLLADAFAVRTGPGGSTVTMRFTGSGAGGRFPGEA